MSVLVLALHTKKLSKKYLDIHSRGKSDKNGIFDIVKSCSIFDEYIFQRSLSNVLILKYAYWLSFIIFYLQDEFEASKKCQVSLVVKYIEQTFSGQKNIGMIRTKCEN